MTRRFWVALALLLAACSPRASSLPRALHLELPGSDGRVHDVQAEIASQPLSVFVFYSEGCACLDAHEPRLSRLQQDYAARGVGFFLVDSEVSASVEGDRLAAEKRRYAFPLLTDRGARLADALGAEFATHAVVVTREGRIAYAGGIDSDYNRLRDDAKPYLRNALDALLAGQPVNASGEALGCALRLH